MADAVFVPSHSLGEYYRRTIRLRTTVLPCPIRWDRVRSDRVGVEAGQFVTFVNPSPGKGVFWFAGIARELARRRPDIRLMVVQGRTHADWLGQAGLDPFVGSALSIMPSTPDPRQFYQATRLLLVPSLCHEALGRVAVEALINGIPTLASTRGGLPEALNGAGYLFDIPAQYTPASRSVPTAKEVEPWVSAIERLWDDEPAYAAERRRALTAAGAWREDQIVHRFETFFHALKSAGGASPAPPATSAPTAQATARLDSAFRRHDNPPTHALAPQPIEARHPENHLVAPSPVAVAAPPLVSVIMPVYNGERFLGRAIDSILRQTFMEWELLALDDGSTDQTAALLEAYARSDRRIRPAHWHHNRGPAAARNNAISRARGQVVAYLDCDDEYHPDFLLHVSRHWRQCDVLVFTYDLIDERPGSTHGAAWRYDPAPFADDLPRRNIFVPLAVAHRRALFTQSAGFDPRLHYDEDTDLWQRFAAANASFGYLPCPSGVYHIRHDSQSRRKRTE